MHKYSSFQDMEDAILLWGERKRLVLACAQDRDALSAVIHARRRGVVDTILLGDVDKITGLLTQMGEPVKNHVILPCADEREAAEKAAAMVASGEADIPMKGLMQTSSFLKAILNKEYGFVAPGALLSQATVLERQDKACLMFISDCAINISPDLDEKRKIIENVVGLAGKLGYEMPKVAVVSAVETVRDKIPSTVDAQALADMPWRDCVVGGPFALDNAVDEAAARHKGIDHPVAGHADVLIMPDLCTGNVFTKSLTFFAHLKSAGAVCGPTRPIVMTSRTDTPEDKYYSILTAVMQCREP